MGDPEILFRLLFFVFIYLRLLSFWFLGPLNGGCAKVGRIDGLSKCILPIRAGSASFLYFLFPFYLFPSFCWMHVSFPLWMTSSTAILLFPLLDSLPKNYQSSHSLFFSSDIPFVPPLPLESARHKSPVHYYNSISNDCISRIVQTAETVEAIVSQLMEKQRLARSGRTGCQWTCI